MNLSSAGTSPKKSPLSEAVANILITPEIESRESRQRNPDAEIKWLHALARDMANNPRAMLKTLVQAALELCGSGSAGVSLIERGRDGEVFRWVALAGELSAHEGDFAPRNFSPCAVCLQQGGPVLVSHPGRVFEYLDAAMAPIVEGLILPFSSGPEPAGTIWVVTHDGKKRFDSEDVRIMTSLGAFTAAALQMDDSLRAAGAERERLAESERQLSTRADQLARSNAELQQFAYIISHDLQEPLRMICSYSQLLKRRYHERLDADANEFIDEVVGGVDRMRALIHDLLDYSRASGGALDPEGLVPMDNVLKWALMNLQPAIAETGATITHTSLPVVRGDQTPLAQLLQNLIANSLKYRSARAPEIHISAVEQGPEWLFSVADNGVGIDPAYARQIFGIFKRLHGRDVPGNGIGLAICDRIVERHGGRIWVESQEGAGARFCFTLPRAD